MLSSRLTYFLALVSGVLVLLSFPPFKFGGVLAWIMFVPLLVAMFYEKKEKRRNCLAGIAGLGSLLVFIWLAWWLFEMISWPGFVAGLLLAVIMARGIHVEAIRDYWSSKGSHSKKLPFLPISYEILVIPLVATAMEFLIMNIPGLMRVGGVWGFWSIAKTQWTNPAILHLAAYIGMYGVTFLVLLVNCAIAYGVVEYLQHKRIVVPSLVVLCLFALIFTYGAMSVPEESEGDFTVAVIQSPVEGSRDIAETYLELTNQSLKYNPDLIVWPYLIQSGLVLNVSSNLTQENEVYFSGMFNENGETKMGLLAPDGSTLVENLGYHMMTLPENIQTKDYKSIFYPEVSSLNTSLGNIGILTCIEAGSTLPARARINDGAQLFIVPTGGPNDYVFSWVLGSSAIYRAVEHGVFAIEVIGDYDSSMLIDPYGRVVGDFALEPEIVAGKFQFTEDRTFYSKHGDIFGWLIVALFLILMVYRFFFERKT